MERGVQLRTRTSGLAPSAGLPAFCRFADFRSFIARLPIWHADTQTQTRSHTWSQCAHAEQLKSAETPCQGSPSSKHRRSHSIVMTQAGLGSSCKVAQGNTGRDLYCPAALLPTLRTRTEGNKHVAQFMIAIACCLLAHTY